MPTPLPFIDHNASMTTSITDLRYAEDHPDSHDRAFEVKQGKNLKFFLFVTPETVAIAWDGRIEAANVHNTLTSVIPEIIAGSTRNLDSIDVTQNAEVTLNDSSEPVSLSGFDVWPVLDELLNYDLSNINFVKYNRVVAGETSLVQFDVTIEGSAFSADGGELCIRIPHKDVIDIGLWRWIYEHQLDDSAKYTNVKPIVQDVRSILSA
jgi:hypothetical protein